jgi:hypothetical protein
VTTDREFLSHRGYSTVEFVTPAEFWALLSGPERARHRRVDNSKSSSYSHNYDD